jgi:hypothetical protein
MSTTPTHETPIHEQIALHAFERYVSRGCQNGHDVDDWVWAESSLLAEAGQSAGARSHEHDPHPHGQDHHQHGAHDTRHRHQG